MHAKHNRLHQQAIREQVSEQDAMRFFKLLTSPELFGEL